MSLQERTRGLDIIFCDRVCDAFARCVVAGIDTDSRSGRCLAIILEKRGHHAPNDIKIQARLEGGIANGGSSGHRRVRPDHGAGYFIHRFRFVRNV